MPSSARSVNRLVRRTTVAAASLDRSSQNAERTTGADSLRFSSRKTVGFNNELNKVFIEVVDTRTDTVVEQIPSEKFVKFVSEQLQPSVQRPQDGPNGAVIDKAI